MSDDLAAILNDASVRTELRRAWLDSNPGVVGGHEEGGFIVRDPDDTLRIVRWPIGETNTIDVPTHDGCRVSEADIVASFHTHPNTGADFVQEPSETDKRAVRSDPDLKASYYLGEVVISNERLYHISQDGTVTDFAPTDTLFDDPGRTTP